MTTYAIGDLQGCNQRLHILLERIRAESVDARLVFVGDLVNRGPDSLGTIRHIRALGDQAKVVLGNHDLHLLAVAYGIRTPSPSDTLNDILTAPDREEMLDWLRHQSLAHVENNHLFVHAGVQPQWSAEQTLTLAGEVETALRSPHWIDFLREMYGNTPNKWDESLRGADRLRCIVNALTRTRYCQLDGTMELKGGEAALSPQAGQHPWFDLPDRKTADVTVVFGHWSTLGLTLRENVIGLDTGCVWGGKLTAVCLENRKVLQVDCPQYQQPS